MHILMLSQFIYPPSLGGEERFVTDLSYELAARGHTVAVVALWQKGFPEFEIQRGVHIYRVRGSMQKMPILFSESDHPYAPSFPDPGVMRALRRIIQEERPDIVHAHNWLAHSFTPLKKWSKAKFVVSLHDYSLVCVQKRLMRQEVNCTGPETMKCLACGTQFYGFAKGPLATLANFYWGERARRAVDLFLPVSQATADGNQLDRYGVPYKVLPNFIPDRFDIRDDEADPLLAQLPQDGFLLFVGDVSFDKGAETLLQAYTELRTSLPLVFIGRYHPYIPDLGERLPPNVLLMGPWPHEAVMGAWKRCTIGLVPSIVADACPTVAMEAMVMGKPVIATRIGGLTDIVMDGETGLLVPPGDSQALREALQDVLNDPERRTRMGAVAQERVTAFQASSVVSRLEEIYRELIGVSSAASPAFAQIGGR